jgi:hypothetical protein
LHGKQHPVEASQPFRLHLGSQLVGDVDLGLRSELKRHQLASAMADAMRDIVAGDVEHPPLISNAAHQDMGVRVAGVVVVDGDPVETRSEIALDLSHEIAGEGAQVLHLDGILGCDDEAELMPVATAALDKRPALVAVATVLERGINPALFAVARHAVALKIAQMRIDRPGRDATHLRAACTTLGRELDHARLDHHPPCPEAASAPFPAPTAAVARQARGDARAASPCVEPAAALVPRRTTDPAWVAAGLADSDLHLREERHRVRIDARAAASHTPRPDTEISVVTVHHGGRISGRLRLRKTPQTLIALQRAKTGCGAETSDHTSRQHNGFASTTSALTAIPPPLTHLKAPEGLRFRRRKQCADNNLPSKARRERQLALSCHRSSVVFRGPCSIAPNLALPRGNVRLPPIARGTTRGSRSLLERPADAHRERCFSCSRSAAALMM